MKKLMFLLASTWHNYILYLKGWGTLSSRLLTHEEMYRSHILKVSLARTHPA